MSDDLRPSDFRIPEYLLVLVGARPVRCSHCFQRQYAIISPPVLKMIAGLRKLDAMINLIHPDFRDEFLSERRRKKRKAKSSRRKVDTPQHPSSTLKG
ncbi:MAG: hypothetical protein AB7U20_04970 [Planctomycetaceae bacterium]